MRAAGAAVLAAWASAADTGCTEFTLTGLRDSVAEPQPARSTSRPFNGRYVRVRPEPALTPPLPVYISENLQNLFFFCMNTSQWMVGLNKGGANCCSAAQAETVRECFGGDAFSPCGLPTQDCRRMLEDVLDGCRNPGNCWEVSPDAWSAQGTCAEIDECVDQQACWTPEQNQLCVDNDRAPSSLGNALCSCGPGWEGTPNTGAPASCIQAPAPPPAPPSPPPPPHPPPPPPRQPSGAPTGSPSQDDDGGDGVAAATVGGSAAGVALFCFGSVVLGNWFLGGTICMCSAAVVVYVGAVRKRRPDDTPPFTGATVQDVQGQALGLIRTLKQLWEESQYPSVVDEWMANLVVPEGAASPLALLQKHLFASKPWAQPQGPFSEHCIAARSILRRYTHEPQDDDALTCWPGAPTKHRPEAGAAEQWEKYIANTMESVGREARNPCTYRCVNASTRAAAERPDDAAPREQLSRWAKTASLLLALAATASPKSSVRPPPMLLRMLGNLPQKLREDFGRLRPGMYLAWSTAVASTTSNRRASADFLGNSVQRAVLFRMHTSGRKDCGICSAAGSLYPDEGEWLVPFGSIWRITRVRHVRLLSSVVAPGTGVRKLPLRTAVESFFKHPLLVVDLEPEVGLLDWCAAAASLCSSALRDAERACLILDPDCRLGAQSGMRAVDSNDELESQGRRMKRRAATQHRPRSAAAGLLDELPVPLSPGHDGSDLIGSMHSSNRELERRNLLRLLHDSESGVPSAPEPRRAGRGRQRSPTKRYSQIPVDAQEEWDSGTDNVDYVRAQSDSSTASPTATKKVDPSSIARTQSMCSSDMHGATVSSTDAAPVLDRANTHRWMKRRMDSEPSRCRAATIQSSKQQSPGRPVRNVSVIRNRLSSSEQTLGSGTEERELTETQPMGLLLPAPLPSSVDSQSGSLLVSQVSELVGNGTTAGANTPRTRLGASVGVTRGDSSVLGPVKRPRARRGSPRTEQRARSASDGQKFAESSRTPSHKASSLGQSTKRYPSQ
eukprot:TRINITY_DN47864_c0_g1_i1.p1 TRINITY_DN47864_c0_g1~~TRINITY_DN47864_c0_g1_i1.p1  ORF type:complete len:1027 (+),score=191.02 TRINITY_DN47864_c0_g1_i1:43-3081(+)